MYSNESMERIKAATRRPDKTGPAGGGSFGGIADWLSRGLGHSMMGDSSQAQEQYRHNKGWVHASVRVISQRIADQPAHVARRLRGRRRPVPSQKNAFIRTKQFTGWTKQGSELWFRSVLPTHLKELSSDLELVEDHPLARAIDEPNEIMVRSTMLQMTVASLEITGRSFWWCFQDELTKRIKIWPFPAHWFRPVHGNGKLYDRWIIAPDGGFGSLSVPGSQVVYFYYPDPSNPFNALGTLQAHAPAVLADESIATAQHRSFQNGIFPGLAIVVGKLDNTGGVTGGPGRAVLSQDQRDHLLETFARRYRGVYRYDEPAIIDGYIEDIKKITQTNKEMDWLNSGKVTKERVTQGFGVNPISMGQVEAASRAGSAVADDHLCSNTLNPKISMISQIVSAWMGPIFEKQDEDLVWFMEEATSFDPEFNLLRDNTMFQNQAKSINEYRQSQGMPPIRGGDVLIINGLPVPCVPKDEPIPDAAEIDEVWGGAEPPADPYAGGPPADGPAPAAGMIPRGYFCVGKSMTLQGRKDLWLRNHKRKEQEFARRLQTHWQKETKAIADKLRRAFAGKKPTNAEAVASKVFDVAAAHEDLVAAAGPHVKRLAYFGASLEWELTRPRSRREAGIIGKRLEKGGDLPGVDRYRLRLPRDVQSRVDSFTGRLMGQPYWRDMSEGTRERIVRLVDQGIRNGDSGEEIADMIEEQMGGVAYAARARTTARTETTGALNAGGEVIRDKLRDEGLLLGKEWLSIEDDDTREAHLEANGQTVKDGEQFEIGGEECDYPGDMSLSAEQRCNCRCTTLTQFIEEDEKNAVKRFWQKYYG